MSSWIKKNIISVTKGDSLWTQLSLSDSDGNEYVPDSGDVIIFSLKGAQMILKLLFYKNVFRQKHWN